MRTILRDYQKDARDKAVPILRGGGGFMLIPEQRTGKTVTALAIYEEFIDETPNLMVVCPKVAIPVWADALSNEKCFPPGSTFILNYEQYVANRKYWYRWGDKNKGKFFMIVDESHMIKARGADRSRVVRRIGRRAKYRLALTGTPIANGLIDAWAQFDFIDPTIFGPFDDELDEEGQLVEEHFNGRYIRWGGYQNHEIIGYRNEEEFQKIFHKYSYRITLREAQKEGGKTPFKLRITKSMVSLTGRTQFHYDEMKEELQTVVDEKRVKVKNVLASVTKLQQITGGSVLTFEHGLVNVGHEKMEKLHEIIRSLRSRSKFVIICKYIHEIERIHSWLKRQGYTSAMVRGGQPFDGKFHCDAIVMQIKSGMAVDMSQADDIIFYSTDYSYLNLEQARFRVLAYAKEYARYYFLLAEGTIDEQIFEAVTRKKNLAKLVIDTYRRKQ